jgi:D-3-phosphoglycerate dehydrogenase
VRVFVADTFPEQGLDILRKAKLEVVYKTDLKGEALKKEIAAAHGVIVRSATKLTAELVAEGAKLRAICRAGVGVDNVDLDAATKRGIIVMNTPAGNTIATAEHTVALMLALSRKIPQACASLHGGGWDRKRFMGTQVAGKVLGVVGLGRVGCSVARRAVGLEMKVIGYDPFITKEKAAQYGVELKRTLDEVLPLADYVTVHTPLTDETQGLIGEREFGLMKRGVRVLNCARGGIIDEAALLAAVQSGKVAGAALDVFVEEPPKDRRLLELDAVIATPHLGASTEEAQVQVSVEAAEQMADALLDRGVRNAVNLPTADAQEMEVLRPYATLADRMGSLAMQLIQSGIKAVEISYSGEVTKHNVKLVTTSFLCGLLRPVFAEEVNLVNAPLLAADRGIQVRETTSNVPGDFSNLLAVRIDTEGGTGCSQPVRSVAGTLFGKRDARIVEIDGYLVEAIPQGNMLVLFNHDRPGLIGAIGTLFGRHRINIARMTFGRKEAGGDAITVLNVDSPVPPSVLKEVEKIENVTSAHLISL